MQITDTVKREDQIPAGIARKNAVIFAVLVLLRTLRRAQPDGETSARFKKLISHVRGDDFARLLVSEKEEHRVSSDENAYFLTPPERELIQTTVLDPVSGPSCEGIMSQAVLISYLQ